MHWFVSQKLTFFASKQENICLQIPIVLLHSSTFSNNTSSVQVMSETCPVLSCILGHTESLWIVWGWFHQHLRANFSRAQDSIHPHKIRHLFLDEGQICRLAQVTETAATYEKKSNHTLDVCWGNCRQSWYHKKLAASWIISLFQQLYCLIYNFISQPDQ